MQAAVRGLVKNGQLEFNLGGMCMNDEANTDYAAIIDQMTDGAQFLLSTVGAVRTAAAAGAWARDGLAWPHVCVHAFVCACVCACACAVVWFFDGLRVLGADSRLAHRPLWAQQSRCQMRACTGVRERVRVGACERR
jgi:hypothetical protein